MTEKMRLLVIASLALMVSACFGDHQVEVRAKVSASSACKLRKLTAGKMVAEYRIEGAFTDSFAVPSGSGEKRTIEVICNGKLVLTRDLVKGGSVIDLGEL